MKAIVFGGSGFLGSHVADMLTHLGYQVTVFDIAASPYLLPEQRMILGSILDEEAVKAAVQGQDFVYNFAGIADLDDATTRPLVTAQLNIIGNLNLLEASLKAGIQRFVYASSIYVYSQRGGFYRCSKQASEAYIEEYQRKFGLPYTILRYGTLYGPRADARNSIYRYIKQAVREGKITYSGSGDEIREYINVRDAARLSVDILAEKYQNQHLILTGQHPLRLRDMALMIQEMLGQELEIEANSQSNRDHYTYTPYSYSPKLGYKLVDNLYLDMGQGLLECIDEIVQDRSQAHSRPSSRIAADIREDEAEAF